jgi:TorA maturation chaperone TorD
MILFDAAAALLLKRPTAGRAKSAAALLGYEPPEAELELALRDWNDLFFVPSSGRYLPPFESAFREKRLGGVLAADALAAYQTSGFDPALLDMDPLWRTGWQPDHLGVELAFVCALLRGENEKLTTSAVLFHSRHVAPWAGDYGRLVSGTAQSGLYRNLGRLLEDLAAWTVELST